MLVLWFSIGFIFAMLALTLRLKRIMLYDTLIVKDKFTETQLNVLITIVSLVLSFFGFVWLVVFIYEINKQKDEN